MFGVSQLGTVLPLQDRCELFLVGCFEVELALLHLRSHETTSHCARVVLTVSGRPAEHEFSLLLHKLVGLLSVRISCGIGLGRVQANRLLQDRNEKMITFMLF